MNGNEIAETAKAGRAVKSMKDSSIIKPPKKVPLPLILKALREQTQEEISRAFLVFCFVFSSFLL